MMSEEDKKLILEALHTYARGLNELISESSGSKREEYLQDRQKAAELMGKVQYWIREPFKL